MPDNPFDLNVLKSSCGYIENFINGATKISLDNILSPAQKQSLPNVDGNQSKLLKYTMLSVLYNKDRKVPFLAAYNIDANLEDVEVERKNFRADPRVDADLQLNQDFYDLITDFTEFEIGHMASHNEMSWGVNRIMQAHQTFHFTNSVPQVERLNSGLWSKLESYVISETKEAENKRIAVFTGPMLRANDPPYTRVQSYRVPLFFFKLVVFSIRNTIYATAFVMSQRERALELGLIEIDAHVHEKAIAAPEPFSDYRHKDVFQVNIDLIEDYAGLNFHWENVSRINVPGDQHKLEEIAQHGKTKTFEAFILGDRETNMILPS